MSGFELGSSEIVCTRDRCGSFSKGAIMSAVLGRDLLVVVCFASLVVVVEGILVVGSPPCRFGWSAAYAEARLSFALGQGWLSLVLF